MKSIPWRLRSLLSVSSHDVKDLRFECTACGDCCRRPGVVEIFDDELDAIAEFRGQTRAALIETCHLEPHDDRWWLTVETHCPFLVDDRCSVHPVRPRQCAAYPFWPEIVETSQTWAAEKKFCPGIGCGRRWSRDEVDALVASVTDTSPD